MKHLMILAIIIVAPLLSHGQSPSVKPRYYHSWYYLVYGPNIKAKGYTYEFADSSVSIVAQNKYKPGIIPGAEDLMIIPVKGIDNIHFRARSQKGIGILVGISIGVAVGATIGYMNGDDPESSAWGVDAGTKALVGGFIGGGIGVGLGGIIGTMSKIVRINGQQSNYIKALPDIQKYSIKYYYTR